MSGSPAGYALAAALLAAGALLLSVARAAPGVLIFAATAVAGIGYAGAQVFPLAMLPDITAVDAVRSGRSRACVFTGVWTAGETLGLVLGPGLYAVVLSIGGYVSSAELVDALRHSRAAAAQCGSVRVPPELAEAAQQLDPDTLTEEQFDGLLDTAGLDDVGTRGLPERMAPINALLEGAPAHLREALLIAFLERLMRPARQ